MLRDNTKKQLFWAIMPIVVCSAVMGRARAEWLEQTKLIASDGASGDWFGIDVGIDGDYCIIGADGVGPGYLSAGAAYIFKHDGTTWTEQEKLVASDGASGDRFGLRVSISGDYVLIGAPNASPNGTRSGAAYIFERNGESWTQKAKLTPSDGAPYDDFGNRVSIDGSYAIVGAQRDDIGGVGDAGSVYIFEKPLGGWTDMTETAKLTASDGDSGDIFGSSVSIKSSHAIVGACRHDTDGLVDSGSVYIFEKPPGGWIDMTETVILTAPNPAAHDAFGSGIYISGDVVNVGAPGDDSLVTPGSSYIFRRDGGTWTLMNKLTASDGSVGDFFGCYSCLRGNSAVISAHGDDSFTGSVYVFERNGDTWTEQAILRASDRALNDNFGACAISGRYVIVGSPGDDGDNNLYSDCGSVYIFTCNRRPVADPGNYELFQCACQLGGTGIELNGSLSHDPDGDPLTYTWTGPFTPCPAEGRNPIVILDGCVGEYTVTLIVNDGEWDSDFVTTTILVVDTIPPIITCPAPITLEAEGPGGVPATHQDIQDFLYGASSGDNCDPSPEIINDAPLDKFPIGDTVITFVATDDEANSSSYQTTVTVRDTTPPEITVNAPESYGLYAAGDLVLDFSAYDLVSGDIATPTLSAMVTDAAGYSRNVEPGFEPEPGVYTLSIEAEDEAGNEAGETLFFVVYDPSGGFVTGGGWIDSPPGAFRWDEDAHGKANFGFISKYKKGATEPTGQTEFVFHAGDLNFNSNSYEWLVVTGSDYARFKGWGTINGDDGYRFMLWAGDGPDTFRIRIWVEDGNGDEFDVYDNGMHQEISGGSIVVHAN